MKSTIKSASIVLTLLFASTGIANALEYEKGNASVQTQRQAEEVNRQLDSIGFVDMNNPSQAYLSSPSTATPSIDLKAAQPKTQPEAKKDPLRHDF